MLFIKASSEINRGVQPLLEIRIAPHLLPLDTPSEDLFNRCRQIAQNLLGFSDQRLAQKEFDALFSVWIVGHLITSKASYSQRY
jgi:hypothetical protein